MRQIHHPNYPPVYQAKTCINVTPDNLTAQLSPLLEIISYSYLKVYGQDI